MDIDLTKCRVGTKVKHKNGEYSIIDTVEDPTRTRYPVHCSDMGWFTSDGINILKNEGIRSYSVENIVEIVEEDLKK